MYQYALQKSFLLIKNFVNKILRSEGFFWLTIALLLSGGFLLDIYNNYYDYDYIQRNRNIGLASPVIGELIKNHYSSLLASIFALIFPLAYLQVFGKFPFEALRGGKGIFADALKKNVVVHGSGNIINFENDKEKNAVKNELNKLTDFEINEIDFLNKLVLNSEKLSNKIYTRSGVYLLFGVLIAFGGVLYFSFQSISPPVNAEILQNLILLAPKETLQNPANR